MSHWTIDMATDRYLDLIAYLEDLQSELETAHLEHDFAWAEDVYTRIIQARDEILALTEHFGFEK